jgi:2-dehydro-3-deoxyphosphogluconate aldolase / (4S)-4-hydroxy-2-oxoglutarate aldolase
MGLRAFDGNTLGIRMSIERSVEKIAEIGIIPVVRANSGDEARSAVEAIHKGGISIIEITMTVPDAPSIIREVSRHYGDKVLTGAGTVTTVNQAEMCLEAGAEFLVSPGLSVAVVRAAAEARKLAIPGALTPTDVMAALDAGVSLIKIFPCGSVGGPKYIKSLRGPFPGVRFIPTGGVNLTNVGEYLAAGAFAVGVGADLVDLVALRNNQAQKVTDMARTLVDAVRLARIAAAGERSASGMHS